MAPLSVRLLGSNYSICIQLDLYDDELIIMFEMYVYDTKNLFMIIFTFLGFIRFGVYTLNRLIICTCCVCKYRWCCVAHR